jgi:hypothetical protein
MMAPAASAETVGTEFRPPETVRMFEHAWVNTATGRSKTDCADAYQIALGAIEKKAQKRGRTVVAVFDHKSYAPFVSAPAVSCQLKGKKQVVQIGVLSIKQGESQAYPMVSGARIAEVVEGLIHTGSMVALQVASLKLEDRQSELYLKMGDRREEVFSKSKNQNDRAVLSFRENVAQKIGPAGMRVAGAEEIHGVAFVVATVRMKKGEEVGEKFHYYTPKSAAIAFNNGEISEQSFLNQVDVLLETTGRPVKIDVNFLASAD